MIYIRPVSEAIIFAFDTTNNEIMQYSIPTNIAMFFMSFVNIYIVSQIGLKAQVLLGCGLTVVGCAIDLQMVNFMWFLDIGQPITMVGIDMFRSLTAVICDRWFNAEQRPFALAIVILLRELSPVFNMIFPHLFIKNGGEMDQIEIIEQTRNFNRARVSIAVVFFLIIMVFFKEWPKARSNNENAEA